MNNFTIQYSGMSSTIDKKEAGKIVNFDINEAGMSLSYERPVGKKREIETGTIVVGQDAVAKMEQSAMMMMSMPTARTDGVAMTFSQKSAKTGFESPMVFAVRPDQLKAIMVQASQYTA